MHHDVGIRIGIQGLGENDGLQLLQMFFSAFITLIQQDVFGFQVCNLNLSQIYSSYLAC